MPEESAPQPAPPLERRLATILCADVAGYSQMMGANEERTVRVFRGHREIFESLVAMHRGRIFNTAGDALLAEFNSAVEAVRCATEIQAALRTRNEHLAPEEKMQFRIGINLGDVIIQGGDLLGDGVNVAARIQTATEPGGICISGSVHDQIQNKLSLDFKLLGEQTYKNIAKPVRTYTINEGGVALTAPARRVPWRVPAGIAAAAVAIAGAAAWGYQQYETRRIEQQRVEAELAAQKRAAEQAQRAAEDAKREAQLQAQRAIEDARRDAQLQAQRLAAEDALRRAQEERSRVEQDRRRLEADRRAQEERARLDEERKRAEAEKQAAEARQRAAAAAAAKSAPQTVASQDGSYNGRLCNNFRSSSPQCWPAILVVRKGSIEASWLSTTKKTSTLRGTIAANGAIQLQINGWKPNGEPNEAKLQGRIADGTISASGKWMTGGDIAGQWKRAPSGAAVPSGAAASSGAAAPPRTAAPAAAPKRAGSFDGRYDGQLCNMHRRRPPTCWSVELAVQGGSVQGSWQTRIKDAAKVSGSVAADGSVVLKFSAYRSDGTPVEGELTGRINGDTINATGLRSDNAEFSGNWKRKS